MARILIIEDNAANAKLARFALSVAGHEVLEARDAFDGLALARSEKPQLVLMDIQLPGMDGLDAIRAVKSDPAAFGPIKVIALTAFAMTSDEERCRACGCDEYLAKPYSYRALLALVARLNGPGA